jgi:hypothetical protein
MIWTEEHAKALDRLKGGLLTAEDVGPAAILQDLEELALCARIPTSTGDCFTENVPDHRKLYKYTPVLSAVKSGLVYPVKQKGGKLMQIRYIGEWRVGKNLALPHVDNYDVVTHALETFRKRPTDVLDVAEAHGVAFVTRNKTEVFVIEVVP